MNLILWRHADAEDIPSHKGANAALDMERALTKRGRQQAALAADWLKPRLPDDALVLVSPARRAIETAAALGLEFRTEPALAPDAEATGVLAAAGWPDTSNSMVVVVGHQPTLGRVASRLLAGEERDWPVRKSGMWWFVSRRREHETQVVLRAVLDGKWL